MKAPKLQVALEQHFVEVDGKIYTDVAFDYEYWQQYADVFDRIEPIARVRNTPRVPEGWVRADGPNVHFHKIYDYRGFWQFLGSLPRVLNDARRAVREPAPVLLRMGAVSLFCWPWLWAERRPYAIEATGDIRDGVRDVRNVQYFGLNRLIAALFHTLYRTHARNAFAGSYVSEYTRAVYPTRSGRNWVFSSVRLGPDAFAPPRPAEAFTHSPLRLVAVGRLEPEKGHAVLVDAVAELRRRGVDVVCDFVGPGGELERLRDQAKQRGIGDRVRFHGLVSPGDPLRKHLKGADMFVLPSFTEGMPRALIEGMAMGLPAVASNAGGIPELLPAEVLVPPRDHERLADAIEQLSADPERMAAASRQNLARAKDYSHERMQSLRTAFWHAVASMDPAMPGRP